MKDEHPQWFHESLVLVPMSAADAADAITRLGTLMQEGGFVTQSFVPAVIKREQEFPTGLPTADVGVAIPHTDVEHVVKQAIAVGVLDKPVQFREMGNPDGAVPVQIVCVLAVAKSEIMVRMLQSLVQMFQTPGLLRQVVEARDAAEVVAFFQQHCQVE
jgi:PTS system galactitol-specific IIA component